MQAKQRVFATEIIEEEARKKENMAHGGYLFTRDNRREIMLTPIKAIRAKCLECSCGQTKEVRLCTIKNCALHPYRMGHRPKAEDLPVEDDTKEKS